MRCKAISSVFVLMSLAGTASAQDGFHPGTVIPDFGKVASVPDADPIPEGTVFKIAYDVAKADEAEGPIRGFTTPARFLNMHAEAGVPVSNMHLAIVVHGKATSKLVAGEDNPNQPLIEALLAQGVKVTVCGQSAAAYGVSKDELIPGVTMSLSAMTAHALLQQSGYTVNPF